MLATTRPIYTDTEKGRADDEKTKGGLQSLHEGALPEKYYQTSVHDCISS